MVRVHHFVQTCEDSLISSLRYMKGQHLSLLHFKERWTNALNDSVLKTITQIGSIGESERWLRWRTRAPHGYYGAERYPLLRVIVEAYTSTS